MKKIGIVTLFHKNYNWGGVLQAYALKKTIEREVKNVKVDIIKYNSSYNIIYPTLYDQIKQYSLKEVIIKFFEKKFKMKRKKINKLLKKRIELFDNFMIENTSNEKEYTDENFMDLSNEYDCLICGSDQIWNPNVARAGFFLDNVNTCKKIAYSASIARNQLSDEELSIMVPLIKNIDNVSVREKTAKNILDKELKNEKDIYETLDPTLLLSKEEWLSELKDENNNETKKEYAVAFFFSDSLKYRKNIEKICEEERIELKFIPFAKQKYLKNDEKGKFLKMFDIGPREFLQLINGGKYIFTDSFHGAVFSIIFKKEFIVFERDKNTKVSKNSRLYDLLEKFELKNRVARENDSLKNILKEKINYEKVNEILEKEKKESLKYLRMSINEEKKRNVKDVKKCYGCFSCFNICPVEAIKFEENNEGFKYPKIIEEKCNNCGLCRNVCPRIDNKISRMNPKAFAAKNKDEDQITRSSSGGIFPILAENVLEKNGKVYGAVWEGNKVIHVGIEKKEDISKMVGTKYLQSEINKTFKEAKQDLEDGKLVLYTGTPCQIAALKKYLIKDYENLYTQDLICHGVPSKKIWEKYLKYQEKKVGKIVEKVDFRNKTKKGWKNYQIFIKGEKREKYINHNNDLFMKALLSDIALRESCYKCEYKKNNRESDITLADFWGIDKICKEMNDKKGVSLIIVNSRRGEELLKIISEKIVFKEINIEEATKYNPSYKESPKINVNRKKFLVELDNKNFEKCIKKYTFSTSYMYKIFKKIKRIIIK